MKKLFFLLTILVTATFGRSYSQVMDPADALIVEALNTLKALETQMLATEIQQTAVQKSSLIDQAKILLETVENTKVITAMKDMQDILKDAKEDQQWVTKLETLKRINAILEKFADVKKELEINMDVVDELSSLSKVKMDINLAKYEMSLDFVHVAVVAGLLIEPSDRTDMLNQVLARLEEAYTFLTKINRAIVHSINLIIKYQITQAEIAGGFGPGRHNSR